MDASFDAFSVDGLDLFRSLAFEVDSDVFIFPRKGSIEALLVLTPTNLRSFAVGPKGCAFVRAAIESGSRARLESDLSTRCQFVPRNMRRSLFDSFFQDAGGDGSLTDSASCERH